MLPRDVTNKIIAKLDIDSRRSLGIYTRLSIPQKLIELLEAIPKLRRVSYEGCKSVTYCVDLVIYTLHYIEIISRDIVHKRHYLIKYDVHGECQFIHEIDVNNADELSKVVEMVK